MFWGVYYVALLGAVTGVLLTGRALVPLAVLMANLWLKWLCFCIGQELMLPYIDGASVFALILTAPKAPYPETNRCAWVMVAITGLHAMMYSVPKALFDLGYRGLGEIEYGLYKYLYCGLFMLAVMTLWGKESAVERVRGALGAVSRFLPQPSRRHGFKAARVFIRSRERSA